ncbi:MAG: 16S rRNA (adenine(1518)-N(6)/adenine(1519)-N(6))-dimethyltransferase RsmA [Clostridium sp.]|nr:16S rRNA (adenine(1518)-N(6)/adenine(1519)-N(6))-dimethyltransferase RsmA [Clostridium sp.]MCM1547053.1 16S rRNA (adenine(1518)-N(6)/adenine(1519)-N(6))-dimethyltransferase RsmA [Ruminococcus sp.]
MENLTNITVVKSLLEKYGFTFSKGLGQNFLINPSVCPKIAEYGFARKGYGILEIGTGLGVLTAELAKRADKVTAVEIDKRLLPVLGETLKEFDNIKIINKDIMKVDLNELIGKEFNGMKTAVCANLPYYITSPVIMFLLESEIPVEAITVMVQKEAAHRICADVGTRQAGAVTAAVRFYGTAESLFDVSRGSFMPAPKVDSAVIQIRPNDHYRKMVDDKSLFFKVVRGAFSQRRKTMANSLSSVLGISKETLYACMDKTGIGRNARAEQLSMEELIEFSNKLNALQ